MTSVQLEMFCETFTRDRPYSCSVCHKTFTRCIQLKRHKCSHEEEEEDEEPDEKAFKCDRCDKSFTRAGGLKHHLRDKHNVFVSASGEERPVTCQFCGRVFARLSDLKRHVLTHTGERPHRCEVCGRRFTQSVTLTRHRRVHTGERPYRCDKCGIQFTQMSSHNYHRRKQHSTCQFCGKTSAKADYLAKTHQTVTGERPDSCAACWKRFTLSSAFHRNTSVRVVLRFKCDQCGRTFLKSYHLKHHLHDFHREDRPFVCQSCKKTFTQSSVLKYHKCSRSKSRPYGCDKCGKSFTRPYLVKMHKRSHTGANVYTCVGCKMAFSAAFGLMRHRRRCSKLLTKEGALQRYIRPSATPSVCDLRRTPLTGFSAQKTHGFIHSSRNEKCVRARALKRHAQSHSGTPAYPCDQCGKVFGDPSTLRTHHLVHSGSYACDKCERSFITEEKLQQHKVTHVKVPAVELCKVQSVEVKTEEVDHALPQECGRVTAVEMDSFQVEVELEMCEVCSETFNTKDQYYEHLRKHEIELVVV